MPISKHEEINTVVDLLNHLIKDRRDWSWKIEPSFVDGMDAAVFRIIVFEIKSNQLVAHIVFDDNTGKLLNMSVNGENEMRSENIVDAILDLIGNKNLS